ncbi:MAG TPA: hypothetical protein VGK10_11080 [Prolixibacteraceae bacterium]
MRFSTIYTLAKLFSNPYFYFDNFKIRVEPWRFRLEDLPGTLLL